MYNIFVLFERKLLSLTHSTNQSRKRYLWNNIKIYRGCRQGVLDLTESDIFIRCAEISVIRNNRLIKGINIKEKQVKITPFTEDAVSR